MFLKRNILGRAVPLDISNALLDILWDRHLRGAYLPQHVIAQPTILGPSIQIDGTCITLRWLRYAATREGGSWRITPRLV